MILSFLMSALALPQEQAPAEIPKLATAQAQLDHAKEVKKESRGTKGAARAAALDRACAAYGAVLEYWPDSGAITAEAAFRQGEIHRTQGRPGPAKGAFLVAVEQGAGTRFAPRGLLEIGHIHRRAAEFPQALKSYAAVLKRQEASLRDRNDAFEWIGKVHLQLQEWPEAAQAFRSWADNAEGPVELVRAADLECQALAAGGDPATARRRFDEVTAQVEPLAAEPGKEAVRLRKALERCKAPAAIAAAEEKAAAASAAAAGGAGVG
ncbi:MAG: hypothetical protein D6702_01015 [Planctomycetota bacterium]|nr:MAG: hypothetical protein D6702_01015 [Planctomycetota bacterium]